MVTKKQILNNGHFYQRKYLFNQFSVAAVSGPISPRWMNRKYSAAVCTNITNRKEREILKNAPRCEMKCRQYCPIGLEQRKLGISLAGLLKH